MRIRTVIIALFCAFGLLAIGCASPEMASTDRAGTVKPAEGAASSGAQAPVAQAEPPSGEIQERGVLRPPGPIGPLMNAPPPSGFVDLFPFLFANNCSVVQYATIPVQLLVGVGNIGTAVAPPTLVRVQVSQAQTTIPPATIDAPVSAVNPSTFVKVAVTLPNRFNCDGGACQFVITVDPAGAVPEQGQYYGFGKGNNTTTGACYFGG
jgi:hypothetical protein